MTTSTSKPRTTISLVQFYVRRDQMVAGTRSIKSFDASWGLLSQADKDRYLAQ